MHSRPLRTITSKDHIAIAGLFFLAFAIYATLSPGRIDMIDGQWRFEVANNLAMTGSVSIQESGLLQWAISGVSSERYSPYGISGSLVSLPLVFLGQLLAPSNKDLQQALFSLTSPLFGAATISLVFFIFRSFGVAFYSSVAWSITLGFATIFFPLATSVFDQVQNSFFILASFFLAYISNKKRSIVLATMGGVSFIVLINFKEAYIVLWPGLLWVAGLNKLRDVRSLLQTNRIVQIFSASGIAATLLFFLYNHIRFGSIFLPETVGLHPPIWGNFFVGLSILTVSPGKGLLWYSPTVVVVALGWRQFWMRHSDLAQGIVIAISLWIALIASLSFAGGDWCWGPRYWVPVLPLFFLAAPFIPLSIAKKAAVTTLFMISLGIQCLAISVDHHRFFFEHQLHPFFWYENEWFYFKKSALLARHFEISEIKPPVPSNMTMPFRPGPHPESLTYAVFGPHRTDLKRAGDWMNDYAVFSLPRPWPLWTLAVSDVDVRNVRDKAIFLFSGIGALGLLLIASVALRKDADF